MYSIEKSAGQIIAADTQESVATIDTAVASSARLCASVIEVNTASNLPVSASQTALASLSKGLATLVEGRGRIAEATYELLQIQKNSSLRETSFGCPTGLPPLKGHLSDTETGSKVIKG